jgi:hypothetical protein
MSQSSTQGNVREYAGAPEVPRNASVLPGLHNTARNCRFLTDAAISWSTADIARQEQGQADDLPYLIGGIRLLLAIAINNQQYADACDQGRQQVQASYMAVQAVAQVLAASDSGAALSAGALATLKLQAALADATIQGINGCTDEVNEVLNRLFERLHRVMNPLSFAPMSLQ